MIVRGAEQIEFFTRFEPTAKGPPIYFLDKMDALSFLKRLFMNAWDRSELRSLLAKVEGDVKVEAMVLEHNFRTDDCDLYFVCENKKVINFKKNKKRKGEGR